MSKLSHLQNYADDKGNTIIFSGDSKQASSVNIEFSGRNNRLTVHSNALFARLRIDFQGDGNQISIGRSWGPRPTHWAIKVGHNCSVSIGDDVTTTDLVYIVAAEGSRVNVGNDCMFATGIELRATDSHAIFDLANGHRINPSEDVNVGDHCWLATGAVILPGGCLGSGSVLGHRATLLGSTPSNSVVAGVPARVVRSNIEWRRPQTLSMRPMTEPSTK